MKSGDLLGASRCLEEDGTLTFYNIMIGVMPLTRVADANSTIDVFSSGNNMTNERGKNIMDKDDDNDDDIEDGVVDEVDTEDDDKGEESNYTSAAVGVECSLYLLLSVLIASLMLL